MADNPASAPDLDLDDDLPVEITWPKTVGIASIVWGAIGCICNCWGSVAPFVQPGKPTLPYAAVLSLVGVALSITLLVAGILCVQRKPVSRLVHLAWAALTMVSMVVGMVIYFQNKDTLLDAIVQNAVDEQRARGSNMTAEQMRGIVSPMMTFFGYFMPIIFSLWPIFCFVWFGLVKRTRESMLGKGAD